MSAPETPPFDAPWQAQAFALTVALVDRGMFTWPEWTDAFARYRGRTDAAADAGDYYDDWLAALEELLTARGAASAVAIETTTAAWIRASRATPHGVAVALENDSEWLAHKV